MIDFSHPARHAHHVAAHGFRTAWVTEDIVTGTRAWTVVGPAPTYLQLIPIGPAGRGAHRAPAVSLVKSHV